MSFKQHDKREVISSKVNGFTSARRSGIWRGSNVFLGLLVCHPARRSAKFSWQASYFLRKVSFLSRHSLVRHPTSAISHGLNYGRSTLVSGLVGTKPLPPLSLTYKTPVAFPAALMHPVLNATEHSIHVRFWGVKRTSGESASMSHA